MKTAIVGIFLALFAAAASAQVYCWNTKDGKRQCGDTPPPGVKASAINTPAAPSAPPPPAAAADSKGAKKGSPEEEFRKRQIEAQKAREKEQQAQDQAKAKEQNCESARSALRTLETGRVSRTGKDGERYFLDEQQIAQETERARQAVQKNCSS
jgi:hypothetical protein